MRLPLQKYKRHQSLCPSKNPFIRHCSTTPVSDPLLVSQNGLNIRATSETEMWRLGAIGRQATVESHLDPKAAERFQSKCKP